MCVCLVVADAGASSSRDGAQPNAGRGDDSSQRGPLAGLRVIDAGNFLAGPVVSLHLAALGAHPGGSQTIT